MTYTPRPVGHPSPEGTSEQNAARLKSPLERGGAMRRGVFPEASTS